MSIEAYFEETDADWEEFEEMFKISRSSVTEVPHDYNDNSRVYVNKEEVETWNAMRYNMISPDITFYRLRAPIYTPRTHELIEINKNFSKPIFMSRWSCNKY